MRLTQLEGKEDRDKTTKSAKSAKPDAATVEVLKELQQEMHKTMLDADLVMRRLAQILDTL